MGDALKTFANAGAGVLAVVLVLTGPAILALAQPPESAPVTVEVVPVELRGTILNITPEAVQLQTETGIYTADLKRTYIPEDEFEPRRISVPPARIVLDWDGTRFSLRPGKLVRFEAELRGRRVRQRLSEIHVINPVPLPELGLLAVHDFREPAAAEAKGRPAPRGAQRFLVTGRVSQLVRGLLVVEYPNPDRPGQKTFLQARIANDAVVKLEDITFARPDDRVWVKGEKIQGSGERRFWATEIRVSRGGAAPAKVASSPKRPKTEKVDSGRKREKTKPARDATRPKNVQYRGKILKIN